jgi:hypothetical protein
MRTSRYARSATRAGVTGAAMSSRAKLRRLQPVGSHAVLHRPWRAPIIRHSSSAGDLGMEWMAPGYLTAGTVRRLSSFSFQFSLSRRTPMQNMAGTGTGSVATDETDRLIASNKVEGTAVYNRQGERMGSVYNFMVDKRSGQVAYAVMSFGGFLGMGDSYHPLPWSALTYDTKLGGYVVDLDKERLKGAPSYTGSKSPTWDQEYGSRVDRYYGGPMSE